MATPLGLLMLARIGLPAGSEITPSDPIVNLASRPPAARLTCGAVPCGLDLKDRLSEPFPAHLHKIAPKASRLRYQQRGLSGPRLWARFMNAAALRTGFQVPAYESPPSPCPPEERRQIFQKAGIDRKFWASLDQIITSAPARDVGKGALDNVVGSIYSQKCKTGRRFESHTVERAYLYSLELDPSVLAYCTQVTLTNVDGTDDRALRKVWSVTADVLVLREDSVTIVECKSVTWLQKEVTKPATKWRAENGAWTCESHESWAAERGIGFEVFAQEAVSGIELQNLEFIYAMSRQPMTVRDETILRRAKDVLPSGPKTVIELAAHVPGYTNRHTGMLLARGLAHGLIKTRSISNEDEFVVFDSYKHARTADLAIFDELGSSLAPINLSRPILTATSADIAIAIARHKRIVDMDTGRGKVSDRTRRLARQMTAGIATGLTAIEALLGETHLCGNRRARLDEEQYRAVNDVVKEKWANGRVADFNDLYFELEKLCLARNIEPPSKTTLRIATTTSSFKSRVLRLGGMRAYQSSKNITPPDRRSLPSIAYGHTLHIDSSSLDNRSAPNVVTAFPANKARFYIGIDGATAKPMAHALIFGPARTDGIAILLREFVSRNGFLPSLIVLDRGTENTSRWFKQFCFELGISWMYAPTGGSRYNSLAENAIGRVNGQMSHKLTGSTKPDQYGRAVDGKFKSRKNAFIQFEWIAQELKTFLYDEIANTPDDDNITPNARAEELLKFGEFTGSAASLDSGMIVITSVPAGTTPRITGGYVRTARGKYTSLQFQAATEGVKRVDELRSDCVDPSVMYARVKNSWFQIFNRAVLKYQQLPELQKLWRLMIKPIDAAAARETKSEIARARYDRHTAANAAAVAHQHLAPAGPSLGPDVPVTPPPTQEVALEWEALDDFE